MLPLPLNILLGFLVLIMSAGVAGGSYFVVVCVPTMMLILGLLTFDPLVCGAALLLVVLSVTAIEGKMRAVTFGVAMLAVVAGANGLSLLRGNKHLDDLYAMRRDYPLVSLKSLLDFHETHPVPGGAEAREQYLKQVDRRERDSGPRAWMLRRLHDESYERFIASPGFGYMRMIRVSPGNLKTPPVPVVKVTTNDICFDPRERPERPRPETEGLDQIFRNGLNEFVDRERMGFVESIDRTAGFEPHAVATVPDPLHAGDESWRVARLELVSLLRHDEPVVYVSDNLPNLEDLSGLATRPLDEFERSSLAKLQEGQTLVTADEPAAIRMLGAVRASETCLACHSVPQTTLLGAFSYELRPELKPHSAGD